MNSYLKSKKPLKNYFQSKAIFPILKENSLGDFHLIGTGFFIADSGIFVTAKHLLLDVIDKNGVQTHPIFFNAISRRWLKYSKFQSSEVQKQQ